MIGKVECYVVNALSLMVNQQSLVVAFPGKEGGGSGRCGHDAESYLLVVILFWRL